MTTPSGNILFNNSSGSDTAASGLGPATALTGSGASTDGTAVVTGISTTGASAGDLLWVQTASGRQFAIIASVDSGTQVTCDDTFALGSGQTWAIGGKRQTIGNANSALMFQDAEDDWTIELEDNQTISSAITWSGGTNDNIGFRLIGSSGSIKTVTQTGAAAHFSLSSSSSQMENLKFLNSNGSPGYVVSGASGATIAIFIDCVAGEGSGGNNPLGFGTRTSGGLAVSARNCVADYCGGDGFGTASNRNFTTCYNCKAIGCTGHGFAARGDGDLICINCIADSNGGDGFYVGATTTGGGIIVNCVSRNNTGDGVSLDDSGRFTIILNSHFTENGAYGAESRAATIRNDAIVDGCNFGTGATANTSGDVSGFTKGANCTNTDPAYNNTATGDYTPASSFFTAGVPQYIIDTASVASNQPVGVVGGSGGGGATGSSRLVNGGLVD